MDDAEVEWRAHTTQICQIEANAEKNYQEVLTTTNIIQDAIKNNNIIFTGGWEAMHDRINRHSEDILLLRNWVVDLEALLGLQQTTLQSCQNTIAGLEETVTWLVMLVQKLEKSVCQCHNCLLSPGLHYVPGEEEEMVEETEEEEDEEDGLEYMTNAPLGGSYMTLPSTGGRPSCSPTPSHSPTPEDLDPENNTVLRTEELEACIKAFWKRWRKTWK